MKLPCLYQLMAQQDRNPDAELGLPSDHALRCHSTHENSAVTVRSRSFGILKLGHTTQAASHVD